MEVDQANKFSTYCDRSEKKPCCILVDKENLNDIKQIKDILDKFGSKLPNENLWVIIDQRLTVQEWENLKLTSVLPESYRLFYYKILKENEVSKKCR